MKSLLTFLFWPYDRFNIALDKLVRWGAEHTNRGRFLLYEEWRRGWEKGYSEGRAKE